VEMTEAKTCKLGETWCEGMNENLDQLANAHKRGLTTIVLMNRKTGKDRLAGVAYRKGPNDKGLMLNYCPWCGEPIEQDAIAENAAQEEAAR